MEKNLKTFFMFKSRAYIAVLPIFLKAPDPIQSAIYLADKPEGKSNA